MLDWINFGKLSAERDDLLTHYFFDNGVLNSVIGSRSSFLVLGRKGAGKTAVFRYLTDNSDEFISRDDILVSLSFEDYNWSIHELLVDQHKAESLHYKQSWRFVILVEAVKAYKKWFDDRQRGLPKSLDRASAILEKLFDSPLPSIYQIVGRKLLTLSELKLPSGGLELDGGELDSLKASAGEITFDAVKEDKNLQRHLSENIENLINYLDKVIVEGAPDWPTVYICFDRVDEAWDEVSYEASKKVIAGLVSAGDAINSQFGGKVRPIIFLREDIFDVLSLNDANKLREDCGALLHWTKETLNDLVLRRVNFFGSNAGQESITDLDAMFDRPEMKQRAKPSNYLLRRTMMRPRDMIALLSRTVDTMKEKATDPFADEPVTFEKLECESIYGAEPGYSEWLKQELFDEWRVQHPVIVELFQAIQNNGSTNFSREAFVTELSKLVGDVSQSVLLDHLRFLFDNSIVGFKQGASKEWRFKCFSPSQGFVESDEYKVHEGLVRALNLTEPRQQAVVVE